MPDRYERIRAALEMGPTHGPWHATKPEPHGTGARGPAQVSLAWCGCATAVGEEGCYSIGAAEAAANAALIAACDPDTIRELLAERDQLAAEIEALRTDAERYRWLRDKGGSITVCECADDGEWIPLHPENMDATIDAAMEADRD